MDVRRCGITLCAALMISAFATWAPADAADDALLAYVGLSNGQSYAYRTPAIGGTWTLDSSAMIPDAGSSASPTLVKLDGDGDLDALVGEGSGYVRAFRNTGTNGNPVWTRNTSWEPAADFGSMAAPAVADLDSDGDRDLLVGTSSGEVLAIENIGTSTAPQWALQPAWKLVLNINYAHPTTADFNKDGKTDMLVGLSDGRLLAFAGSGNGEAPFVRADKWDGANVGTNAQPGAGDVDGDGRPDVLVVDSGAHLRAAYRNSGGALAAQPSWLTELDAGSGPGGIAFLRASATETAPPTSPPTTTPGNTRPPTTNPPNTTPPTTGPGGNRAPVARIVATPATGNAPLNVALNASGSSDADGNPMTYAFNFGDGTAPPPVDVDAAVTIARNAYREADSTRESGHKAASIPKYLAAASMFSPLTGINASAPFSDSGFTRVDHIARLFLMRIGHDLGGLYLYNTVAVHGLDGCDRYGTSYLYSLEGIKQAELGGFGDRAKSNGTTGNLSEAKVKLQSGGCAIPDYRPMFPVGPLAASGGSTISHTYAQPGNYLARVTVSDGKSSNTASVEINVRAPGGGGTTTPTTGGTPPTPPPTTIPPGAPCGPAPGPPGGDAIQGFGNTAGGSGGEAIVVCQPTEAAVKEALSKAKSNSDAGRKSRIVFTTRGPITVNSRLSLNAANVTIEGNGVTLVAGSSLMNSQNATLEVVNHDVIVRDARFRNAGDNVSVKGPAYNVAFTHISSTGAHDDGISIGYGAKNVTVQYSFLAGNTRSIFIKYGGVNNISLHHNWIMKQWIRGPLANEAFVDFRNNIVEDWVGWGVRYESDASGNVVNSIFGWSNSRTGDNASNSLNVASGPVYVSGNEFRGNAESEVSPTDPDLSPVELNAPAVTTQSVAGMEPIVRGRAGAMPRDAVDQAYINLSGPWSVGKTSPLRLGP